MKVKETSVSGRVEFLGSAKFKAIPFKFTSDTKSGEAVAVTDPLGETHYGFCLYDVEVDENPNGAVVCEGIINFDKLPSELSSAAKAALYPTLIFV